LEKKIVSKRLSSDFSFCGHHHYHKPKVSCEYLNDEHCIGLRHFPVDARYAAAQLPLEFHWPSNIPDAGTIANIHFALANLHQDGTLSLIDKQNFEDAIGDSSISDKFDETCNISINSAFYHYQQAAFLGSVEACLALARIYSANQLILEGLQLVLQKRKIKFLQLAAQKKCKEACYWLGNFYQTGDVACEQNIANSIQYYSYYLDNNINGVTINPEILKIFGWEVNMKMWEIKANLAQLLSLHAENNLKDVPRAISLLLEASQEAMENGQTKKMEQYKLAIEVLKMNSNKL